MADQQERSMKMKKVILRYVNGPTRNYHCEEHFILGSTAMVSAETAKELLLKVHNGEYMFTKA